MRGITWGGARRRRFRGGGRVRRKGTGVAPFLGGIVKALYLFGHRCAGLGRRGGHPLGAGRIGQAAVSHCGWYCYERENWVDEQWHCR